MTNKTPRITFGIIVLNGEPFIKYNLRALYPFAHQIIVVEGAAPAAGVISTPDGHSTDSTLDSIRCFQAEEDYQNKVLLVTAEDEGHHNGFWPGEKDEQSQAYAKRATGDYIWQVDSDEFYLEEDMERIISLLRNRPEITTISFKMVTFWGGFDIVTDSWFVQRLHRIEQYFHRVFKWGPGYQYSAHRPPIVLDENGVDLRKLNWIKADDPELDGIFMLHYSLLFPQQVIDKCRYYQKASWTKREKALSWVKDNYIELKNPFRVHNVYDYPSWLDRYTGDHPSQILAMKADIESGKINISLRQNQDVGELLSTLWYKIGRFFLKKYEPVDYAWRKHKKRARKLLKRVTRKVKQILE